jgi:hypothetical protein
MFATEKTLPSLYKHKYFADMQLRFTSSLNSGGSLLPKRSFVDGGGTVNKE